MYNLQNNITYIEGSMFEIVFFFALDGEKEDEGSIVSTSNENGQQGAPVPETCIETTVPKQGQNLW